DRGRHFPRRFQPAADPNRAGTDHSGGGGGAGAGVALVVGAVVGSGAVWVCCRLEAPGEVATTVWLFAPELSASHSADAAPAAAATIRASSDGQIQSPGYQPSRLRQAEPSSATTPLRVGSLAPHSRQYSWLGL